MRVLAYHAIADLSDDPVLAEYAVPPGLFAAQLDELIAHGWSFVDLDAALAAAAGERRLSRRALLLSFDDAYSDLLEVACPILAERGLPGVVFAVAGRIGSTNEWDNRGRATTLRLLDGEGLRAVAARGIEVGSHTMSHRSLPGIPISDLEEELAGAARRIEAVGLPRPRVFSYPYGEWSSSLAAAAREAGYEASFTVEPGVVGPGADLQALPRVEVHASDTPRKLRLKLLSAGWPRPLRERFLRLARVSPGPGTGPE